MTMGYFLKSINLLNLLIAAAAVATAHYIVLPLVNKEPKITLPAIKAAPAAAPAEAQKAGSGPAASPLDFAIIANQNLFHPERKIPVEKPPAPPPPPKPELVLYGTLITDDLSLAYVEDKKAPLTTPGRGKRLRVLKIGDALSGFVLKSIEPDKIVLVRGDEVMTVNLDIKSKNRNPAGIPPLPEAGSRGEMRRR